MFFFVAAQLLPKGTAQYLPWHLSLLATSTACNRRPVLLPAADVDKRLPLPWRLWLLSQTLALSWANWAAAAVNMCLQLLSAVSRSHHLLGRLWLLSLTQPVNRYPASAPAPVCGCPMAAPMHLRLLPTSAGAGVGAICRKESAAFSLHGSMALQCEASNFFHTMPPSTLIYIVKD